MSQAAEVISVMPDALSPGILREIADKESVRLENAHSNLHRLRGLIETFRDVEYDDRRVDGLLACIGDLVGMTMLLTGGGAHRSFHSPVPAINKEMAA
ncbi:MAG: hypothetical protein E2598_07475 [Sphingobium sp.]|nr:hypothetical protein [Sphingobium sp.]